MAKLVGCESFFSKIVPPSSSLVECQQLACFALSPLFPQVRLVLFVFLFILFSFVVLSLSLFFFESLVFF